jgi:hypothetical protein
MKTSRSRWIWSGPSYHLVRPWTRKHSSGSVCFMRSTKPLVRGERTFVYLTQAIVRLPAAARARSCSSAFAFKRSNSGFRRSLDAGGIAEQGQVAGPDPLGHRNDVEPSGAVGRAGTELGCGARVSEQR